MHGIKGTDDNPYKVLLITIVYKSGHVCSAKVHLWKLHVIPKHNQPIKDDMCEHCECGDVCSCVKSRY